MRSDRSGHGGAVEAADIYAVRLIDRRSGLPLRSNGATMTIFTSFPDDAAGQALSGRDPEVWEVRIDRIATVESDPCAR